MKKQTLAEGQEWEKTRIRDGVPLEATRVRILSSPGTRRRVKVGTVTTDGRVIREREMLVSAFSDTPKGYRLVKDVGVPGGVQTRSVPERKYCDYPLGMLSTCPKRVAGPSERRCIDHGGMPGRAPVTDPTPVHAALDRWLQEQTSGAALSDPMEVLRTFIHHPDAPDGTETWEAARADARLAMLRVGRRIHALEEVAREVAAMAQATGNSRAMGWAAKLTVVLEAKP